MSSDLPDVSFRCKDCGRPIPVGTLYCNAECENRFKDFMARVTPVKHLGDLPELCKLPLPRKKR